MALLGVGLYAFLLPGHLTSQFKVQLYKADVGMFADAMCTPDGKNPAMPETNCPICQGLASFQTALVTPAATVLPTPPHAAPLRVALKDDVAGAALPAPRSRGPPLPA